MEMFSPRQLDQLRKNGRRWLSRYAYAGALVPVARLVAPKLGCSWLVAALHPTHPDRILVLRDLDDGYPQIRWTSLKNLGYELLKPGSRVVRDASFHGTEVLAAYADMARKRTE